MRKKSIVLIAGALIAAGGAAAFAGVGEKRGRFSDGPGMGPMLAHMGGHGFGFGGFKGERLKALDTNSDGVVTLEEALAERSPVFARLDNNGDGVIDHQEIEAEVNLNVDYWSKAMLKRFDRDKDGKISKEEFGPKGRLVRRAVQSDDDDKGSWREHHREGRHGKMRERRHGKSFDRLDLNSDGMLDASEIEASVKPSATRMSNRPLRRLDQDKDGRITREEFEKPARDRFAMRDVNGDGRITEDDLPPMMRGRGILR